MQAGDKMKLTQKSNENKIFFVTFILLCLTALNFILQRDLTQLVGSEYYPLYVVNYNCGFSSRLLVGAVFSLFFKETLSVQTLTAVLFAIYILLCLCLSLFINNYLKNTAFEMLGIYAAFMIVSPAFVSVLNYFGILDIFWFFCTMGALAVMNKKGLRWLVPVFCIIGLAIHEVFLTTYLPVIAIAVLYRFIKKPCAVNFIFVAVCAVVVGAASVYFLIIGDSTMKMTADEMVEFARSRLSTDASNFPDWYMRSVFFWEIPNVEKYEGFSGYLQYNLIEWLKTNPSSLQIIGFFLISDIISSIPFIYLIVGAFRKAESPAKKFVYLCCLMTVPLLLLQIFFSTDTERFSMHWLTVMLFILLFFAKENDSAFRLAFEEAKLRLSEKKISLAFFGIAAARIILSGVRF